MNDLIAAWLRDELTAPLRYWVKHLSDGEQESLKRLVVSALSEWRARQPANETTAQGSSGKYARYKPLASTGSVISFSPFGYAGHESSDIDLAFKLWIDDDLSFGELIRNCGLPTVLAMTGLIYKAVAPAHSLVRLNGFLVRFLILTCDLNRDSRDSLVRYISDTKRKKLDDLAINRLKGAETRKQARLDRDLKIYKEALDFAVRGNPTPREGQIIAHLETFGFKTIAKVGKEKPLGPGTIGKIISGALDEARLTPRPKPSLYSTEHKSND